MTGMMARMERTGMTRVRRTVLVMLVRNEQIRFGFEHGDHRGGKHERSLRTDFEGEVEREVLPGGNDG
jgi:hypothetical protein